MSAEQLTAVALLVTAVGSVIASFASLANVFRTESLRGDLKVVGVKVDGQSTSLAQLLGQAIAGNIAAAAPQQPPPPPNNPTPWRT